MRKRGKVGTGGREIMAALWGKNGRPETAAYNARCCEQELNAGVGESLVPSYSDAGIAKKIREDFVAVQREICALLVGLDPVRTDRI